MTKQPNNKPEQDSAEEKRENIFEERSSSLLRGLHLGMSAQAEKSYSARSEDEGVRVKISGRHEIEALQIDGKKYGLKPEQQKALEENLKNTLSEAIEKSQAGAARTIRRALRPKS